MSYTNSNKEPYLQILKDLVKNNMKAVLDMRKAIQNVTQTAAEAQSPPISPRNVAVKEEATLRTAIDPSLSKSPSGSKSPAVPALPRAGPPPTDLQPPPGRDLYSSMVRVVIPQPMSPFVNDNPNAQAIIYKSRSNHLHSSLQGRRAVPVNRSSTKGIGGGQDPDADDLRSGSIIRRTDKVDLDSPRSANIELALKSLREDMLQENPLMQSKAQYYADYLSTERDPVVPLSFDVQAMTLDRQTTYFKELSEIETQYVEDLKVSV